MCVRPLGREGPLEEGMATHSRILGRRIPWTEEPGGLYSPWGRKESDTTEATSHARPPLRTAPRGFQPSESESLGELIKISVVQPHRLSL